MGDSPPKRVIDTYRADYASRVTSMSAISWSSSCVSGLSSAEYVFCIQTITLSEPLRHSTKRRVDNRVVVRDMKERKVAEAHAKKVDKVGADWSSSGTETILNQGSRAPSHACPNLMGPECNTILLTDRQKTSLINFLSK